MNSGGNVDNVKKRPHFRVPHVYVLLFFIMAAAAIATYILPAGQFERIVDEATGRTIIDPNSFHYIESAPVSFFFLFKSIPLGIRAAVDVIFMVVLTMAGMEIINQTGALKIAIANMIKAIKGKEYFLLIIVGLVFTAIGAFVGWAEGIMMFVPIGVALSIAMGFDALVGFDIVTLMAGMGFAVGVTNIYTVGVAQGLLGLPLFSGLGFRMVMLIVLTIVSFLWILRYAKKVKENPAASHVSDLHLDIEEIDLENPGEFTLQHKLVLVTLVAGFVAAVYGCLKRGWFMVEIGACFTLAGVIGGLFAGMNLDEIAENYGLGARKIISAGITIGLARAILVILEQGLIVDTIIFYLANMVQSLPTSLTALGMYLIQVIINTFIPSGSGQAVVTIPILGPLAEIIGSQQQVAVIAYQLGDGFTNRIIPTSAALMGGLAMAGGIPWSRYARHVAPIMGIWIVIGGIFVIIADMLALGPF